MTTKPRAPTATVRLQLTPEFGFLDAARHVGHFARLGVSHLYLSPIFEAVPGSSHGYDHTNPNAFREEFGGAGAFHSLSSECERADLGIILDIVPNHMSASHHNAWWYDVLKHGKKSQFEHYFDIDWSGPADEKVVLPVLGDDLDGVIRRGELLLEKNGAEPALAYYEHRFPLSDESLSSASEDMSPSALRDVLDRQYYCLARWQEAPNVLNYRRFFEVAGLVGVRVEERDVFDATHGLIIDLVKSGKVTGLRIDHIDGLWNPAAYLKRLRNAVAPAKPYLIVEKILARAERLPKSWPISGTTGYEWLNRVNGVFVAPEGFRALAHFRAGFTNEVSSFHEIGHESKLAVMDQLFGPELRRLAACFAQLAERRGSARLVPQDRQLAIRALTAQMETYRTYLTDEGGAQSGIDPAIEALSRAIADAGGNEREALELLQVILAEDLPAENRKSPGEFIQRWQQFSGPVMAKGIEDTAMYRYNALTSLNEVGGEPGGEFVSVDEFHSFNIQSVDQGLRSLLTSSTHDTKRSEDARARINVISEIADEWTARVSEWSRQASPFVHVIEGRRCPSADTELLFYQTLIAVLPSERPEAGFSPLAGRVTDYMMKAVREAKLDTSWLAPNEEYERSLRGFISTLLGSPEGAEFRESLAEVAGRIAFHGAVNSLGQVILKAASPGVPDFYQGCENWDLSLVDPDNRRPVDWAHLERDLNDLASIEKSEWPEAAAEMLRTWHDGKIKQWVAWRSLSLKTEFPDLFMHGQYAPISAAGPLRDCVFGFERTLANSKAVALVTRMSTRVALNGNPWTRTAIELSEGFSGDLKDVLTGRRVRVEGRRLDAADIFAVLPVALLRNSE